MTDKQIKSQEAYPILRLNTHLFRIITLYVIDKTSFIMQKSKSTSEQLFQKDQDGEQNSLLFQDKKVVFIKNESNRKELETFSDDNKSPQQIIQSEINNQILEEDKSITKEISQSVVNKQNNDKKNNFIRRANSYLKHNPSHFKHGERNLKNCLLCNEKNKKQLKKDDLLGQKGGGIEEGGKKEKGLNWIQKVETQSNVPNASSVIDTSEFIPQITHQLSTNPSLQKTPSITNKRCAENKEKLNILQQQQAQQSSLQINQNCQMQLNQQQTQNNIFAANSQYHQDNRFLSRKDNNNIDEFQKRRITMNDFIQGEPGTDLIFQKDARKFNRELLKVSLQVIGCKPINANQISEGIFDELTKILNNFSDHLDFDRHFNKNRTNQHEALSEQLYSKRNIEDINVQTCTEQPHLYEQNSQQSQNKDAFHYNQFSLSDESNKKKQIHTITISGSLFKYILSKYLEKYNYSRPEYLNDFYIASDLVQSKRNIIILLAGTSGTGKSTLASLLGSRLGISTVLSTDTIRHIMRNFVSKEDNPILFASTYETAQLVSQDILSEKIRALKGYKLQCELVQTELEKIIEDFNGRNESVVIEGVHLTVGFMVNMMKKYPTCIPFVICIKSEEKHKERFAVRSKQMTIDPNFNKYIKHVRNIRIIQKDLIRKAAATLIPRIDNSNVDKSIGLIHVTIVKCLRQISENKLLYDPLRKQATVMYYEFNQIQNNQLSGLNFNQLINQKIDKKELIEKYLKDKNYEIQEKLSKYKKGTSMIDIRSNYHKSKRNKYLNSKFPIHHQREILNSQKEECFKYNDPFFNFNEDGKQTQYQNKTIFIIEDQYKKGKQQQKFFMVSNHNYFNEQIEKNHHSSINVIKIDLNKTDQINPNLNNQTQTEKTQQNQDSSSDDEINKRSNSIAVIMRPDHQGEHTKLNDFEKKNIKKRLIQKDFENNFPEDEDEYDIDSVAAKLAATSQAKSKKPIQSQNQITGGNLIIANSDSIEKKNLAGVNEKIINDEEKQIKKEQKKKKQEQQRKIEEENIQKAVMEAQKKEKDEIEKNEKREKERIEKIKISEEINTQHQQLQEVIEIQNNVKQVEIIDNLKNNPEGGTISLKSQESNHSQQMLKDIQQSNKQLQNKEEKLEKQQKPIDQYEIKISKDIIDNLHQEIIIKQQTQVVNENIGKLLIDDKNKQNQKVQTKEIDIGQQQQQIKKEDLQPKKQENIGEQINQKSSLLVKKDSKEKEELSLKQKPSPQKSKIQNDIENSNISQTIGKVIQNNNQQIEKAQLIVLNQQENIQQKEAIVRKIDLTTPNIIMEAGTSQIIPEDIQQKIILPSVQLTNQKIINNVQISSEILQHEQEKNQNDQKLQSNECKSADRAFDDQEQKLKVKTQKQKPQEQEQNTPVPKIENNQQINQGSGIIQIQNQNKKKESQQLITQVSQNQSSDKKLQRQNNNESELNSSFSYEQIGNLNFEKQDHEGNDINNKANILNQKDVSAKNIPITAKVSKGKKSGSKVQSISLAPQRNNMTGRTTNIVSHHFKNQNLASTIQQSKFRKDKIPSKYKKDPSLGKNEIISKQDIKSNLTNSNKQFQTQNSHSNLLKSNIKNEEQSQSQEFSHQDQDITNVEKTRSISNEEGQLLSFSIASNVQNSNLNNQIVSEIKDQENENIINSNNINDKFINSKIIPINRHSENVQGDDVHSIHSGASGLASLISQSVDYFQAINQTEDNRSQLVEESGESGSSRDGNSVDAEASDHEINADEFQGEEEDSESDESDKEDKQAAVIKAKEEAFNNKQQQQLQQSKVIQNINQNQSINENQQNIQHSEINDNIMNTQNISDNSQINPNLQSDQKAKEQQINQIINEKNIDNQQI